MLSHGNETLYETGSELVTAETAVSLDQLFAAQDSSQAKISQGLNLIGENNLAALYDLQRKQTVLERSESLHRHETYHLGQPELLREVSVERESFP